MTDREAYVAFNLLPDVGSVKVAALAAAAGSVSAAWEAYPDKRTRTGGPVDWQRELARATRMGVTVVTPADAAYPPRLAALRSHPLVFYVVGNLAALSAPGAAMVGTRAPTPYGVRMAERFAHDLAQAGLAVFSGLAVGIDAASHRGALAGGGVTVGILGGAIDEFFPEENRKLARRIVDEGGAVMSEFPFGRPPDKQTFPQRNRTVAALSRAVLAVEAPLGSGTLITCAFAQKLGRPVLAVPANLDSHESDGCWKLIRGGVRIALSARDVVDACRHEGPISPLTPPAGVTIAGAFPDAAKPSEAGDTLFSRAASSARPPRHAAPASPALPPRHDEGARAQDPVRTEAETGKSVTAHATMSLEEARIYRFVTEKGISVDALCANTGLSALQVNAATVSLRLQGLVRFLPGNRIARVLSRG